MLNHFRQRAIEALAQTRSATLGSSGPGGLQVDTLPCQSLGLRLFLLVPGTSEQLVNLEEEPSAIVTADGWRGRGVARAVPSAECPSDLLLVRSPDARWSRVVEVRLKRLEIGSRTGWGYDETLDLE